MNVLDAGGDSIVTVRRWIGLVAGDVMQYTLELSPPIGLGTARLREGKRISVVTHERPIEVRTERCIGRNIQGANGRYS